MFMRGVSHGKREICARRTSLALYPPVPPRHHRLEYAPIVFSFGVPTVLMSLGVRLHPGGWCPFRDLTRILNSLVAR